jgi:hypothetical protein
MPYDGDPAGSEVNAVRFWAQDTGAIPLLTDDEIDYLISYVNDDQASPVYIAALAADRIASKYVGQVAINADGVSYSGDQLQQRYGALATELRRTARRQTERFAAPYVGGVKMGEAALAGVREPQFGIGMFDNPEGGNQEFGYLGELGEDEESQLAAIRAATQMESP